MTDLSKIPLSPVRAGGHTLYLSGQLGFTAPGVLATGGIAAQTRQAIENVRKVAEAEGATLADVVKTTVWLTNKQDFPMFNDAYSKAFDAPYPARSTVICDLAIEGALVEIEAIIRLD